MSDDSPTNLPADFTNQPTAVTGNYGSYNADAKLAEGAAIGRYQIIRLIGEGGMGAVYEAEQDQPRRTVALKVIKPGLASPELLRRFAQESQALGRLQHPGIAQIYEAGTADTGFGPQPYFAMEFIRGKGLRDYVEERHLNTRDRLEIVAKVCDAVHHAHQRGLIHRDLKPGNILVDETGQPKILDFGVARVTDSDAQATMQTDVGQLVGTLAYMSPEQVLADPLELDTRSDVYALGVIFYELLAARLPYNISKKLHEALQAIREEEPARLSSINRIYQGDIETIAAKALEKDKARRYASAAELAADIRHYLKDEPIVARPPSTSYQLQKFARRHKALVLGIAAVFVVLVGGAIAATLQAVRAGRAERAAEGQRDRAVQAEGKTRVERDRATTAEQDAKSERDRALAAEEQATSERNRAVAAEGQAKQETAAAKALNDFLRNDVLALADPLAQLQPGELNSKPNPNLTVRELLDKSAARMTGKFDKQPLVEAALRETIGGTYSSVGASTAAQQQLERALDLRIRNQGETNAETLLTMSSLAGVYATLGRQADAEALLQKAVDGQTRALGEQNPATLASMGRLANLYAGNRKFDEAEKLLIKVMDGQSRIPGGTRHPAFTLALTAMVQVAQYYRAGGRPGQADELVSKMDAVIRPLPDDDSLKKVLRSIVQLAQGAVTPQSFAQSLSQSQPLLDISAPGQETLTDVGKLQAQASLLIAQSKFSDAEPVLKRMLEAATRLAGKENRLTVAAMTLLAGVYPRVGKLDAAEELWMQILAIQKRTAGEDAPETLNSMAGLSNVYKQQGKTDQARNLAIQRLDLQRRALSREDPQAAGTRINIFRLAVGYGINSKYKEAEELFTQVLEIQRRVLGDQQENTASTKWLLAWVRVHQQKYAEAEGVVREAFAFWEKTRPNSWERYNTESILGAVLAGQKKFEEAEERLLSGHNHLTGLEPTNLDSDIQAIAEAEMGPRIVQLYLDWGKPEQAAAWRKNITATGPRDAR